MILANFKDRLYVPWIEPKVKGSAPKKRCLPVIEQSFHFGLYGSKNDQATNRTPALKAVNLGLKQRR